MDINIFKDNNFEHSHKLSTSIYFKETFTGHLIHSKSLHPKHLKLSVIKSQFSRVLRKCTHKTDFDKAIQFLSSILITQGYKHRTLRNIKYEVLFNSGYYFTRELSFGFYKCNNCNVCKFALETSFVYDNNFHMYRIFSFINCNSQNTIFSIYCTICGPVSVLFSKGHLFLTIRNLVNIIHTVPSHPLSLHFYRPNHSINNFRFQGIQSVSNIFSLQDKLLKWIIKLNTFINPGVDQTFTFNPSYRLVLPFAHSNQRYFSVLRSHLKKKFNVHIQASYSSFPNFKNILCKSKL